MPTYEYECGKCGVFEVSQRISDAALSKCPTCRRKVRRLISSTSFQLKGSGWYVTDYARGGKGKTGAADGGDSAKSESAGDAKSDSKTDSKSDSKIDAKPKSGTDTKSDTKATANSTAKAS